MSRQIFNLVICWQSSHFKVTVSESLVSAITLVLLLWSFCVYLKSNVFFRKASFIQCKSHILSTLVSTTTLIFGLRGFFVHFKRVIKLWLLDWHRKRNVFRRLLTFGRKFQNFFDQKFHCFVFQREKKNKMKCKLNAAHCIHTCNLYNSMILTFVEGANKQA